MRSDMSKVIVERPRCRIPKRDGSWYPRGSLKMAWFPDLENAPMREGMGAVYAEKRLNENLQPLVRFLRTCVGRPWDKVHGEIAEQVTCDNAVQRHVLEHLRQFVIEHPKMIDGLPHEQRWSRSGSSWWAITSRGMRLRFYVCPRTRLLRLAPIVPRKRRRVTVTDPDLRVLSATRELRRMNGLWFQFDFGPFGFDGERPIVCKMQLGTRALELHGLRERRR
jgi:hypothetical protein